MTHEAGLKAACNKAGSYGVHRPSERCMADSIQAYLSASGMVLLPRKATDEMKFHTLVAGYLASGASGDEALYLAKDKMDNDSYPALSDAQYVAMIAAFPDPFTTTPTKPS